MFFSSSFVFLLSFVCLFQVEKKNTRKKRKKHTKSEEKENIFYVDDITQKTFVFHSKKKEERTTAQLNHLNHLKLHAKLLPSAAECVAAIYNRTSVSENECLFGFP